MGSTSHNGEEENCVKVLSVVVPCHNSADYMHRCVDSLLVGAEDVEIIIVDDGSTDSTASIADFYAATFPHLVRVIHQENGGHGAAVNAGIAAAQGTYVKIVDSDDWLSPQAYATVLELLRSFVDKDRQIDLVVSNFVYETEDKRHKRVSRYTNCLPVDREFSWASIGRFRLWQYMLMHSLIYRTEILRECGLQLPHHSFYVDNLYAFIPLPSVQRLYYANIDLYRYFIGREDQSVNETVMIGRLDQQTRINREMFRFFSQVRRQPGLPEALLRYMAHYLQIITMVSSMMALVSRDRATIQGKEQFWDDLRREDPQLTDYMRKRFFGQLVNLPGRVGEELAVLGYRGAQKVIGFN